MKCTFTELSTMSSQLTTLVQTFDGSNYQLWSKTMKAWLQSQGLWGFVDRTIVCPVDPAAGAAAAEIAAAQAAIAAWVRSNDMAMGNLVLRLNPSIQESLGAFTAAEAVWDDLCDRYGAATIPQVYKDFKEAINIRINPNAHPSLQLDRMAAAFQRLSHVAIGTAPNVTHLLFPSQMQAMVALAALPFKWEHLIHIIINNYEMEALTFDVVKDAIINQWDTETNCGGHKGSHNAQKLSAVKHKRGDPRFNQQQGSSQQRTDDSGSQRYNNQHGQRGKGKGKGKGKDKGKQWANNPSHVHIASIATLPAPIAHTVAHVGSSDITKRVVTQQAPKERTPGAYPSLNKALTLTERLEVKPTIQTIKMLEQRFAKLDAQFTQNPLYNIGDEFDSDSLYDGDMSREPPNTKEEVSFSDEDVGISRAPTPMDQGMLDLDHAFGHNLTVSDYESDDEGDTAEIAAYWAGIPASKKGKSSPTFCDNQCGKYNCLTCQPSVKSTYTDSTGQTKEVPRLMTDQELADLFAPSTGLRCPTPEVEYIGDGLISVGIMSKIYVLDQPMSHCNLA